MQLPLLMPASMPWPRMPGSSSTTRDTSTRAYWKANQPGRAHVSMRLHFMQNKHMFCITGVVQALCQHSKHHVMQICSSNVCCIKAVRQIFGLAEFHRLLTCTMTWPNLTPVHSFVYCVHVPVTCKSDREVLTVWYQNEMRCTPAPFQSTSLHERSPACTLCFSQLSCPLTADDSHPHHGAIPLFLIFISFFIF